MTRFYHLADRIQGLLDAGIVTKQPDPDDGRKWIYSLTAKGVDLAPVLLELSKWGSTYEHGVAPPGVLERWEADRAGFLAELRTRAARSAPGASEPATAKRGPTSRGQSDVVTRRRRRGRSAAGRS